MRAIVDRLETDLVDRWIPSIVYAGTWSAGVFVLSQP